MASDPIRNRLYHSAEAAAVSAAAWRKSCRIQTPSPSLSVPLLSLSLDPRAGAGKRTAVSDLPTTPTLSLSVLVDSEWPVVSRSVSAAATADANYSDRVLRTTVRPPSDSSVRPSVRPG